MVSDGLRIEGEIFWELREEDSGLIVCQGSAKNLVTLPGQQMYGQRGAGIASPAALPTGMKLGTGSTAPATSGAGAALVTYLTGSQQAFVSGYPQGLQGLKYSVTYQSTWAAGVATTASAITEVALVNDTLANATSPAANTVARALVFGVPSKPSGQSLTIAWVHNLG